jgi:hypothetical protein
VSLFQSTVPGASAPFVPRQILPSHQPGVRGRLSAITIASALGSIANGRPIARLNVANSFLKFISQEGQTPMSRNPIDYSRLSTDSSTKDFDQSSKTADTGIDIPDKISDVTSRMKEKAGQVADAVSDTVDKTRTHAADGLDHAASALHEKAGDIPGGTRVESAAHTVADGMESVAGYLRDTHFEDIKKNALETCRKYPAQTLIGALAVGFLVGRAIRR